MMKRLFNTFVENTQFINGKIQTLILLIEAEELSTTLKVKKKSVGHSVVSNSLDYSLPGSSVHGILQARILQQVAIPFFRRSSLTRDQTQVSCVAGDFFFFFF